MKTALLFALLGLVPTAVANPVADESAPQLVMSVASNPGETMDAFAKRIAPAAFDRSMQMSSEICGEIRRDGAALVLDLYTINRLRHCSYRRLAEHDYVGLTYHTHIVVGETDERRRKAKLMNPSFSEEDYDHPGYLASGKKVLFQNGRGTERRVR